MNRGHFFPSPLAFSSHSLSERKPVPGRHIVYSRKTNWKSLLKIALVPTRLRYEKFQISCIINFTYLMQSCSINLENYRRVTFVKLYSNCILHTTRTRPDFRDLPFIEEFLIMEPLCRKQRSCLNVLFSSNKYYEIYVLHTACKQATFVIKILSHFRTR